MFCFNYRFPKLSISPVFLKVNSANSSISSGGGAADINADDGESPDKLYHGEPNSRLSITDNFLGFADRNYVNGLSVLSQISDNSDDARVKAHFYYYALYKFFRITHLEIIPKS